MELAVGVVVGGPFDFVVFWVFVSENDEGLAVLGGFVEEVVSGFDDGCVLLDQLVAIFRAVGVGDEDAERDVEDLEFVHFLDGALPIIFMFDGYVDVLRVLTMFEMMRIPVVEEDAVNGPVGPYGGLDAGTTGHESGEDSFGDVGGVVGPRAFPQGLELFLVAVDDIPEVIVEGDGIGEFGGAHGVLIGCPVHRH